MPVERLQKLNCTYKLGNPRSGKLSIRKYKRYTPVDCKFTWVKESNKIFSSRFGGYVVDYL